MKKIALVLLLGMLLSVPSMATTKGFFYTGASEGVAASSIDLTGLKKVQGSTMSLMSMIALGDASIETLAKKAGITEVVYVDKSTFSLYMFFAQETFTIYGR